MSPIISILSLLPSVREPAPTPEMFEKTVFTDYNEFKKQFIMCISGSCWALTVDYEPIWNDYDSSRCYKNILIENSIRDSLINDPGNLLVYLNRSSKNHIIEIYMYQTDIEKYTIDILNETYTFSFFKFFKKNKINKINK